MGQHNSGADDVVRLSDNLRSLLTLSDQKRPWGFLTMIALSTGLPVFLGAWVDEFALGILGSMGGLVMLYMPQTPIPHRMVTMALCAFGFAVSFTLGVLTSFDVYLSAGTLGLTAFFATLVSRHFALPPPGSFFFILVACLGRTLPFDLSLAPERVGILLFGTMGACVLALAYSIGRTYVLNRALDTPPGPPDRNINAIILESSVIGIFIGGSYLFALLIGLDNPYWAPVSCAAIMQGASFRLVWQRNVHRVVGTVIGMGLAWIILSLSPGVWMLVLIITGLSFIIESLITRNYGLAVIFITPLTVIFADSTVAVGAPDTLILSRLIDIVLGSSFGFVGGWVIHHPKFFRALEARMKPR